MKNITLSICLFLATTTLVSAQKTPEYLWGKFGGNRDVTVDIQGNIFAVGVFEDTISVNGQKYTSSGEFDILVAKLDDQGNYIWVKQYGTASDEFVRNIASDRSGNIYITGEHNIPTQFGADSLLGVNDIFVLKLDNNGNIVWARSFGGPEEDFGINQICTDRFDNVMLSASIFLRAGDTMRIGNQQFPGINSADIFIIKLNTSGNVKWVTREGRFPGSAHRSYGIATDDAGNIYNTGYYLDTALFGTSMLVNNSNQSKMYLTKYDSSGKLLFVASPTTGGKGAGLDVAIDQTGNIYMCGSLIDTTVLGTDTIKTNGCALLVKYDANGNVIWARKYPVDDNLSATNLAVTGDGIYVAITFRDVTLAKYDPSGNLIWSNEYGPHSVPPSIEGLCVSPAGGIYVTGNYSPGTTFGNDTLPAKTPEPSIFYHSYISHIGAFPANIIAHSNNRQDVRLYPNPNSGRFMLSAEDLHLYSKFDIVSLAGLSVSSGILQPEGNEAKIGTVPLPPGIYFLKLYGKHGITPIQFKIE